LCAEIDDKVRAFLARPIEGDWPYLWIDATYEGPLLPFGALVDPVAACQRPQALLTMLYRSTDRLCCRGAPMKNLAHSASFDSEDKDAPSKPGIKHL